MGMPKPAEAPTGLSMKLMPIAMIATGTTSVHQNSSEFFLNVGLVVDEPTDLPEGTEIELLALDPGDWLDEEDRAALHQALKDSDEDIKAGRLVDADVILRDLRSR